MSSSLQLSHSINHIVDELSLEECRRMTYLCGESNAERCAANMRKMLKSFLLQMQQDQIFLIELMLRMRRYDLLKRVLGFSKADAEVLLKNRHVLSDYRVLMTELSEDIGTEDLESLKFILMGTLPKEKLERLECFLDIVVELEKMDQISSTKMEIMERYLRAIRRIDLAKRLSRYHSQKKGGTFVPLNSTEVWQPCRNTLLSPLSGLSAASCSSVKHITRSNVNCGLILSASPINTCQLNSLSDFSSASCSSVQLMSSPHVSSAVNYSVSPSNTYQQSQEAVYQMQSKPRGVCVIIDCVGTEGVKLEQTFVNLHFSVSLYLLLSTEDMLSTLKQISRNTVHYKSDAFICCIISRSRSSRLLGTDPHGPGLDLNAIRHFFSPESCPGLAGKPKMFFIQGYNNSEPCQLKSVWEDEKLETDIPVPSLGSSVVEVAEDADVFWSFCWTNEKQLEKSSHHSVYLHSMRDALVKGQRRRNHLVDIHMSVNSVVFSYNRSHPGLEYHINLRHTLRKNIYLTS